MDILKAREKAKRIKERRKKKKKVKAEEEELNQGKAGELPEEAEQEPAGREEVEDKKTEVLKEEAIIFEPVEEKDEEFIELAEGELQHMFAEKVELFEGVSDYLVFELEGENYALRLDTLREIIRCKDITEVPGVASHISGIISLRGNIIPIVDVKKILSISGEERIDPERNRMLLVEVEGKVFGFKVDEVKGVRRIAVSKLETPPPTLSHIKTEFISALVHLNGELITVLDISKVVEENEETK